MKMKDQIEVLSLRNQDLRQYKEIADSQNQQLESLSKSVENLNGVNRHIGNEWSKTIEKMKQAREEMDTVVDMMNELFEENKKLKEELNQAALVKNQNAFCKKKSTRNK